MFEKIHTAYQIVNQINKEQHIPIKRGFSYRWRKNNRKNTRGRKTQYVTVCDMTVWPIKTYTRCIKHFR